MSRWPPHWDESGPELDSDGVVCSKDTGGSCVLLGCSASRGEAECESRRCVCKDGFCNSHGRCVQENARQMQPTCVTDTRSTCFFHACKEWFGATDCRLGRCICKPGHCSVDTVCYPERRGVFVARVAPVDAKRSTFPHPQDSVVSALAFSGGGARALSFSLGVLRALHNLGLMGGKLDAISSVSGGSWAAAIYMFADMDEKALLGEATVPSELTMDVLGQSGSALGSAATTSTTRLTLQLIGDSVDAMQLWVNVISKTFLDPFGLADRSSYMAASEEDVKRIKRSNPQLKDAHFLTPAAGRPKTFVMSGSLLAPIGYEATKDNVVSLQMSPDYIGSPFYPNRGTVSYGTVKGRNNDELTGITLGGGFVESFAFGGFAPVHNQSGGSAVRLPAPLEPFSLSKALAISSAGPATALTQYGPHGAINIARLDPRANYWAVTSDTSPHSQSASTYTLGDGGNIDNSGVLAMLQRGARRIVWVVNTGIALPSDVDLCRRTVLDDSVASQLENQFQSLFGFWKKDDVGEFLSRNQVFKEEDLLPVVCELQRLRNDGKPAVVSKPLSVLANDWWGIRGAYEATVVIVYIDKCTDFEDRLPTDVQHDLLQGRWGAFHRFPHYLPVFQNGGEATALTHAQVNLLAAQAEYSVMQSRALFERLFDVAGAERG